MSSTNPLIIDDVAAALTVMTDVGRAIAAAPSAIIREAVLSYAAKRGWPVIPYGAYAGWAEKMMIAIAGKWVILDPLFPIASYPRDARRFRLSRFDRAGRFNASGSELEEFERSTVAILDDAAASGSTLRYLTRLLAERRCRVNAFAVCASTRMARDAIRAGNAGVRWLEYATGDWSVTHLRDGCPYLPYTGRAVGSTGIWDPHSDSVEVRRPAHTVVGSPWHSLYVVGGIRMAIEAAQTNVVAALSAHSGREATVADLSLLGPAIPALTEQACCAGAATALRDMMTAS